jgi:hypothetical protein
MSEWTLLERQASQQFRDAFFLGGSVTNISLIAHGTIDGRRRSLLYQPASDHYLTDRSDTGPFTRAELTARIAAGDTLTLMGVPTVSGVRMGLDRDLDGVRDGDQAVPRLAVTRSEGEIRISWPAGTSGTVLEFSESLSRGTWTAETRPRHEADGSVALSVPVEAQARFYRLRRP